MLISDTFQTLLFAPTKCGANCRYHVTSVKEPCEETTQDRREKQALNYGVNLSWINSW